MNKTILFALTILSLGGLASCDEPYTLVQESNDIQVVIEGQVTNQPGFQYVKVSRSTDFYASGKTPRVTDATVIISDDAGNTYPFVHNPEGQADSAGYYKSPADFVGVIGRTYTLRVQADGKTFEASDKLLAVTRMDKIEYRVDEDEANDPDFEGRIYELLMYTREPKDEINYYLFKFFRNDSLTYDTETDIYFSDDDFLAEDINGFDSPVFYSMGDEAQVQMFSLTRAGYIYYNDLSNLLNNDGGMFGPIPTTPRTNLSNGALGFFQVSAVDISGTRLE